MSTFYITDVEIFEPPVEFDTYTLNKDRYYCTGMNEFDYGLVFECPSNTKNPVVEINKEILRYHGYNIPRIVNGDIPSPIVDPKKIDPKKIYASFPAYIILTFKSIGDFFAEHETSYFGYHQRLNQQVGIINLPYATGGPTTTTSQGFGGGTRSSKHIRTNQMTTYKDKNYRVYTKAGKRYIKVKDPKTNTFKYKPIK